MTMKLRDFIRENRAELKQAVGRALGHVPRQASCYCPKSGTDHYHDAPALSDEDLRQWVMNDEGLYRWARREGCRI
jgi:hypothetical protein